MSSQNPKPLFIYGTLRAPPLLAWALTGDATNTDAVKRLIQPAKVHGYACFSLHEGEHPAVIKHDDATSFVDGFLLRPETEAQRDKLRDFEGESCALVSVSVTVTIAIPSDDDDEGVAAGEQEVEVEADIYVWTGDLAALSSKPWDLGVFEREVLGGWLELSGGLGGGKVGISR